MKTLLIAAVLVLSSVPTARADYAVLRSGARVHISGYERDGTQILLHVSGGMVAVSPDDLVRIEPEDIFPAPADPPPSGPYGELIRDAAKKYGLDENLLSSVIAVESNFNPRAVSRKRALGLMQLLPTTAARYAVVNPFDPAQNIDAGTRYLKDLLELYHGDLSLALAAYNAGPERVEQYRGVPPYRETRSYVTQVQKKYQQKKKPKPASPSSTPSQ
ncbi:MAG: lytic transglycosylase domain-containing protein [Candidatus Acidiferrales bacterium]